MCNVLFLIARMCTCCDINNNNIMPCLNAKILNFSLYSLYIYMDALVGGKIYFYINGLISIFLYWLLHC